MINHKLRNTIDELIENERDEIKDEKIRPIKRKSQASLHFQFSATLGLERENF